MLRVKVSSQVHSECYVLFESRSTLADPCSQPLLWCTTVQRAGLLSSNSISRHWPRIDGKHQLLSFAWDIISRVNTNDSPSLTTYSLGQNDLKRIVVNKRWCEMWGMNAEIKCDISAQHSIILGSKNSSS